MSIGDISPQKHLPVIKKIIPLICWLDKKNCYLHFKWSHGYPYSANHDQSVIYANSLDLDEKASNFASHPDPSSLTLRHYFNHF